MPRAALFLFAAGCALAAQVPAGTQLQIRLTSPLNSAEAKRGDVVTAVLIAPLIEDSRIVIAAGVKIAGRVSEAINTAKANEQAVLGLNFNELIDADGRKAAIATKLVEVDNARESVDAQGRIMGIVVAQTGSGRLDQGINKITQRYPGLGDLLGSVKQSVVSEADPNINYPAGVEMTLELTKAVEWQSSTAGPQAGSIEPHDQLARLVEKQPVQTMAASPPRPSDITNLIFIGSEQDLTEAFTKAGWSSAEKLSGKSKLETFRAIVELRGYKEGPMSTLLLDGRPPDLVFQKTNNTFSARHHLRIWRRPGSLNGKPVWVCSSTHDIGIDYSEHDQTFIHRVDPHIDKERAKVVNDLLLTGMVKGLALVDRDYAPINGRNATGDPFITDGRMAAIEF
jgi:hypothetical protein